MTSALPTKLEQLVDQQQYQKLVSDMLDMAKKEGAEEAEVSTNLQQGLGISVRQQQVENLEFNRDKGIGITVYIDKRKGTASTSDISHAAIKTAVKQAVALAKVTERDDYAGLADPKDLAEYIPDLELYHPWEHDIAQAIDIAKHCEKAALDFDKRISNSDGASIHSQQGFRLYGNSNGFLAGYPSSRHSLSCVMIAKGKQNMVRDYDYTVSRDASLLDTALMIGESAAEKTVKRLDARKIRTSDMPVIFSPKISQSILGHFLSAISGSRLFRKTTFLLDSLNTPVFPKHISLEENPHLLGALGSSPFDGDGVQTRSKKLVENGVVSSYILSAYSARKLKMDNTGNAGGVRNVSVTTCDQNLEALCQEMGQGLLVTELMGQGVNLVTGDYSRGASGFWVEDGKIQYPVHEITIASNLKKMFQNIVKIGNDIDRRGNIFTGSIWVDKMMVAGS
tara:strand:+ start:26746 stop:28101 length:1356 start_codon:yes stop_codon:yes gene_type:complete